MKQNQKTVVLWVMFLLLLVTIYRMIEGGAGPQTVAYTVFLSDVRSGRVSKVDIETHAGTPASQYHYRLDGEHGPELRTTTGIVGEQINRELAEHSVTVNYVNGDRVGEIMGFIANLIFPLFMLGLVFMFMRNMQAGNGRAMSFGKSRAKLLNENQNRVTFADVAGVDEAKDDCEEIIAFLKDPKKFQRLGGRIPKGVLLMGSPGTGKTLLARAIAGEAGVPFFSISGSDFVEMFVGVGASRVRDLFEQGKKSAPCIIFIDEIDAVGRSRGAGLGGGHDEREQTLNQLLVEMDGFESSEGVIIIAATNRPDVLDPAILRPGRFDRRIVVPNPDINGRIGILQVHTKKVPLGEDVDLELVARSTPGFSGAELENLVNEAALLAARQDKDFVTRMDLDMAKDKVTMGSERRSMAMTEHEKRSTAWHEAGHTLAGLLLPNHPPVTKVTIIPRGRALGVTQAAEKTDVRSYSLEALKDRICMAFGGRVAEILKFGQVNTGAGNDLKQATTMARAMVTEFGMSELGAVSYSDDQSSPFLMGGGGYRTKEYSEDTAQKIDSEVRRLLAEQEQRCRELLTDRMDKLDAIAEALLERETLDFEELDAVMKGEVLPVRERVVIPRYSEKKEKTKERKKTSLFAPRPREVPT